MFYINRSSKERQIQLHDEFSQKWKEEEAALKAAANSDSGRAARVVAAVKDTRTKGKGKPKASTNDDDDDYVPVGKGGKAKFTFGGMGRPLAPTTRIDDVPEEKVDPDADDSDASSELRLSYVDDIPLRQRFPLSKPPTTARPTASSSTKAAAAQIPKPLTITLPATGQKPLRSVTDILRELKVPATATADTTPVPSIEVPVLPQNNEAHTGARFGGGEVEYSASALKNEATAFAAALAAADLPSQPSPLSAPNLDKDASQPQPLAAAHDSSPSTQTHD